MGALKRLLLSLVEALASATNKLLALFSVFSKRFFKQTVSRWFGKDTKTINQTQPGHHCYSE